MNLDQQLTVLNFLSNCNSMDFESSIVELFLYI